MSVHLVTSNASGLLSAFKKAIIEKRIDTWSMSEDQKYFTHSPSQWNSLAWFSPSVQSDRLVFNIIKPNNKNVTDVVYAVYHGRLIESFLTHFDQSFTDGIATALPQSNDRLA